jgi:hypothetical protein
MLVLRFAEPSPSAARGVQFKAKSLTSSLETTEPTEKKFRECDRSELLTSFLHQTQGQDAHSKFAEWFQYLDIGLQNTQPSLSPIVAQPSTVPLDANVFGRSAFPSLDEPLEQWVAPPYVDDLTALLPFPNELPQKELLIDVNISPQLDPLQSPFDARGTLQPSPITPDILFLPAKSPTSLKSTVAYKKASKKKRRKMEWKFHNVQPGGSHPIPAEPKMMDSDLHSNVSGASHCSWSDSDIVSRVSTGSIELPQADLPVVESVHRKRLQSDEKVIEEKPYMRALCNGKPRFSAYRKYWMRKLRERYPNTSDAVLRNSIAYKYQQEF